MRAKRQLKNKKIIIAIFASILFFSFFFFIKTEISKAPKNTTCATDTKPCPDGSSVNRIEPNCEFSECPIINNQTALDINNNQIEKSIADLLASQNIFIHQTQEGSRNYCVVKNFYPDIEPFPIYVWARCGEFIFENSKIREIASVSKPVKINTPQKSAPYNIGQFTYETPDDDTVYVEEVERIFPENIQKKILEYNDTEISQKLEEYASTNLRSEFELNVEWNMIKMAIEGCDVKQVFQSHDLSVSVLLTNGQVMKSTEPQIDDIIESAVATENKCGKILISTE
ncbi:MAG: hypothetical protein WC178_01805 [Candidatus Paceibacterota bacterium]